MGAHRAPAARPQPGERAIGAAYYALGAAVSSPVHKALSSVVSLRPGSSRSGWPGIATPCRLGVVSVTLLTGVGVGHGLPIIASPYRVSPNTNWRRMVTARRTRSVLKPTLVPRDRNPTLVIRLQPPR